MYSYPLSATSFAAFSFVPRFGLASLFAASSFLVSNLFFSIGVNPPAYSSGVTFFLPTPNPSPGTAFLTCGLPSTSPCCNCPVLSVRSGGTPSLPSANFLNTSSTVVGAPEGAVGAMPTPPKFPPPPAGGGVDGGGVAGGISVGVNPFGVIPKVDL